MIFGVVEENLIDNYTKSIVSKYEDLEKSILAIWFQLFTFEFI